MTSTADAVLQAMRGMGLNLIEKGGLYRSNSPLRPGSDSNAFILKIEDGEHGTYHDHASGEQGSLYDLAKRLNIPTPSSNGHGASAALTDSKRPYTGRADYAKAHGVEEAVFEAAKWEETTYLGRPALKFKTDSGWRYRFLDGKRPSYINETGYVPCLYGFSRILESARDNGLLVLCNGEASTVVAQHYGIPAFATTGGEKRLPDVLLQQFKAQWGKHLIIAFDCDTAGRAAARSVAEQYPDSTVIDLGLGEHGDLADYCHLYGKEALSQLHKLIAKAQQPPGVSSKRLAREYIKTLGEPNGSPGRSFRFPFPSFHQYGGLASTLLPGKMVGIIAPSGGGKTAFVETFVDNLAKVGYDSLFYGPEWTDDELHLRRVCRMGGTDLEMSARYTMWLQEEDDGVPMSQRSGRKLTDAEYNTNQQLSALVGHWPGEIYSYPQTSYIEDTLATMTSAIHLLRMQGRKPVCAVFDYTSLLRSQDKDDSTNRYEMVTEKIKEFTQNTQVVSIAVSQIRKDASTAQKSGRSISSDDALYLRDDKFNLFFSLNRDYAEDPVTKEPIPLNTGYAQITKNSGGKSPGKVQLRPHLETHTWIDPKNNQKLMGVMK